jgi:hypothetical protein
MLDYVFDDAMWCVVLCDLMLWCSGLMVWCFGSWYGALVDGMVLWLMWWYGPICLMIWCYCLMIWCYCDDICAMVCHCMVLCTVYLYMCYICFVLQGFKRKQTKTKFTGAFAVCRHTAKRTKVLYHVPTHGKEATCQQSVDLGGVFWTKWSKNWRKTHGEFWSTRQRQTHGEVLEPTPSTLATHGGLGITLKYLPCVARHTVKICWPGIYLTHTQAFLYRARDRDTRWRLHRVCVMGTYDKGSSPWCSLPCVVRRVSTHGEEFTVFWTTFAVSFSHKVKASIPVVLRGRVSQFFSLAPRAPPLAICFSSADQFATLFSTVSNLEGDNFLVRQWIRRVFNSTDPSLSAAETVKYCYSSSSSKFIRRCRSDRFEAHAYEVRYNIDLLRDLLRGGGNHVLISSTSQED